MSVRKECTHGTYQSIALTWQRDLRHYGIDPQSDVGLMRWMINTFFYLFVGLIIVWIVAV